MTQERGRIVTVSTIRDTVPNVERFLQRNLSSGVDHMIVFLDEKQPRVRALLAENRHVTVVSTARDDYWYGGRPLKVEDRQQTNANLANAVLTVVPSVRWLFHLDCDEALLFDRAVLMRSASRAVRFPTLEALAQSDQPSDSNLRFKKIPTQTQLLALSALGAIAEPDMDLYLRGHAAGKSAVRPDLAIRLGVHVPFDARGNKLTGVEVPPDSFLLHYESWCLDDFVTRWKDYSPKKAAVSNHRERRKQIGLAVYGILHHPVLDDRAKDKYLRALFDRHIADDVENLQRLGLLVQPQPVGRRPLPLAREDAHRIRALVKALRGVDKIASFGPGAHPDAPAGALEKAAFELDRELSREVRQSVSGVGDHEEDVSGS